MQCPLPTGQAPPAPRSASSPAPVLSAAADHIATNGCDYTVPLASWRKYWASTFLILVLFPRQLTLSVAARLCFLLIHLKYGRKYLVIQITRILMSLQQCYSWSKEKDNKKLKDYIRVSSKPTKSTYV